MKKVPVYGIVEFTEKSKHDFFYANDLRTHLASHHFINPPHKHNTYIAILFTQGAGGHQIDFVNYPVKPGSVFFLNPGQVHCWELSDNTEGYVFFHTREFYDSLFIGRKIEDFPFFYLQSTYPVVYLAAQEVVSAERIFKNIYEEFSAQLPWKKEKLGALVDLLYIDLSRVYGMKEGSSHSSHHMKIQHLLKLIDLHYVEKKFPKDYADFMHMSTRHLNRLCQEVLGKTTSDLITERIIIEAKRLLIHSENTVYTVADQLGFEDYSYFVRFFKKKTAISPKKFQDAGGKVDSD